MYAHKEQGALVLYQVLFAVSEHFESDPATSQLMTSNWPHGILVRSWSCGAYRRQHDEKFFAEALFMERVALAPPTLWLSLPRENAIQHQL